MFNIGNHSLYENLQTETDHKNKTLTVSRGWLRRYKKKLNLNITSKLASRDETVAPNFPNEF